jgi:hypothetical protein
MSESPLIELIYDSDCPHIDLARSMIRSALEQIGQEATWTEWDRGDARTPVEVQRYGSPTVLVNGRDVAFEDDEHCIVDANACRVYIDTAEHVYGAPPTSLILRAIRGNQSA